MITHRQLGNRSETIQPRRSLSNSRRIPGFLVLLLYLGGFGTYHAIIIFRVYHGLETTDFSQMYRIGYALICMGTTFYLAAGKVKALSEPIVMLTGLFWLFYIGRLVASCYILNDPLLLQPNAYIYYAIGGGLIPMLAFFQELDSRTARLAYGAVFFSATLTSVTAVWAYRDLIGTSFGRLGIGSAEGVNPLTVAYAAGAAFVFAFYDILFRQGRIGPRFVVCLVIMLFSLIAFGLGASRGALMAIIAASLTALMGKLVSRQYVYALSAGILLLVSIPLGTQVLERLGSRFVDRMEGTADELATLHSVSRIVLIREAIDEFRENPLFGSGLEIKSLQAYPHNLTVEAFLTTGMLGGALFLFLNVWCLIRAVKLVRISRTHGWIGLLFVYYFVESSLSGALYLSWEYWYVYAALIGITGTTKPGKQVVTARGHVGRVPLYGVSVASSLLALHPKNQEEGP